MKTQKDRIDAARDAIEAQRLGMDERIRLVREAAHADADRIIAAIRARPKIEVRKE